MKEDSQPPEKRRGILSRVAEAKFKDFRDFVLVASAATVLGAASAGGIGAYTNWQYRTISGYSEKENEDTRQKLRKLRGEKEKLGIIKDGKPQFAPIERGKHFWKRLWGEFGGDMSKWALESEPALAGKVLGIQTLEGGDWLSFWVPFGLAFPILTFFIQRRISNQLKKLRGRLSEQKIGELEKENAELRQRIAELERKSAELERLTSIIGILMDPNAKTSADPAQVEKLREVIENAQELIKSLPTEIVPDAIKTDDIEEK